jgi:hypothetical protein
MNLISLFFQKGEDFSKLDEDSQVRIFSHLNGVDLTRLTQVCKRVKQIVDKHENAFYENRVRLEYPQNFRKWQTRYLRRDDWKNLYIIADQQEVGIRLAERNKNVLEYRRRFNVVSTLALPFEVLTQAIGLAFGFATISIMSQHGDEIREWMEENPGHSVGEAYDSLYPREENLNIRESHDCTFKV